MYFVYVELHDYVSCIHIALLLLLTQIPDGVDTSEVNTFIPFVDGSNPRWSGLVVR